MKTDKINLLEILQGYSTLKVGGLLFYFKHPTLIERLQEEFSKDKFFERGQGMGLSSESEIFDNLVESGRYKQEWIDLEKDLEWRIDKKIKMNSKLSDLNLIKSNEQSIESDKNELEELKNRKRNFVSNSLENYVTNRSFKESVKTHCFKDEDLTNQITDEEIDLYIQEYTKRYSELIQLETIVKACFVDEFFDLLYLSKDPFFVFG